MKIKAALATLAFIAATAALTATASATRMPGIVVRPGSRVSRVYPALIGNFDDDPTTVNNYSPLCESTGPCDLIPLVMDGVTAPQGGDVVVHALITFDDGGGADRLSAHVLDPSHETVGDYSVAELPTPSAGRIDGRIADPELPRYDLVVDNAVGVNTGFRLDIWVEQLRDDVQPGAATASQGRSTQEAASPPISAGTAARPASSAGVSTASPSDPALPLASRLNGIRPVSDRSLLASVSSSLPWLAVVVAVLLLLGVAFRLRRQVRPSGGIAVRARVSSWFSNLRLFWKLLVPFVAVLLVIGIAGAYLTVHYLASRADTTVNQNLLQRSTSAQTYLRDQELYLLEAERFAANLEGVPEATASSNQGELRKDLASAVAVRKDLDVLAATDASGTGLVNYLRDGQSFSAQGGVMWSDAPAVKEVLAGVADATGDKRTSFVRLADRSVLLVTAGPIRTDRVVGAAVAALSAEGLAKGAASRARGTVGLYDLSGAAMGFSKNGSLPARLSAPEAKGNLRVRHGSVATLYEPFVVRGTKVGTVAVSIPTGSAYASVRGAALRLGLLVALAMAAVVGFGVLVSRYILRTVEPLVETNRALGQGDLSVRAPVRSGDELGELAEGFNLMAEQLQASYGELERRVAERTEELSRLYDQNLEASEARSQFFATISHEFRTPLFAILANAELLADPTLGPESPQETAEFAKTIESSAQNLLARVNELLDLARSESAGVELETTSLSIASVWNEVASGVAALARGAELSLSADLSAPLPQVRADADRLRQILLNLTSNAVKYTPAGGAIQISAVDRGDFVEIAVSDTGQGIPKRVGEKVFEPYYRVKGSKAHGGQASSGLGLALTKRLVEAHGGHIWFESKPKAGTTFFFTLPVAKSKTKASAK